MWYVSSMINLLIQVIMGRQAVAISSLNTSFIYRMKKPRVSRHRSRY